MPVRTYPEVDFSRTVEPGHVFLKRTDDRGRCYGAGTIGYDYRERDAVCGECGQRIGIIGRSVQRRLSSHLPVSTPGRVRGDRWTRYSARRL